MRASAGRTLLWQSAEIYPKGQKANDLERPKVRTNGGEHMPQRRFDGRVAIVTGAGRGLGRAYALLLASRGARVLVNDVGARRDGTGYDPIPASNVVTEIEAAGGTAVANTASVATVAGACSIVDEAIQHWDRVDIVINNAGGGSRPSTIHDVPEDELRLMFDTHVMGAVFILRAAWPHMVRQHYGRVLNTSSAASFGLSGEYAYSAAKAAVLGLTKTLAVDGAPHGIRANALLPMAYTRLAEDIPRNDVREWLRAVSRPEQVAAVAVALVHEDVPFTGEAISAGAGRAARVFFGVVPGFTDANITPETFLANVETVLSTENYIVATQTGDEGRVMTLADAPSTQEWLGDQP
jgi:NAD(P)-dependent dehydrogenase (short-subunit alcohol dehydrogenase family)